MNNNTSFPKEKVKLDEVLKYLFSTSRKVLVNLLNGVFDEDFSEDEVELEVSNNEFVMDSLDIIRGDVFFDLKPKGEKKATYHLEFQTKNDNTMIIRMFEYGFKKSKEQSSNRDDFKTLYFPKQKVIYIEENNSIKDELKLKIIFPDEQEVIYVVPVMKYWEYSDVELIEKKMYPLVPLQLFNLRKKLSNAVKREDYDIVEEMAVEAKDLAFKLADEMKNIYINNEMFGEDFHKMLLAIQNLIEYLNRNYFKNDKIEDEVNTMTKTLYDPEVEARGIQIGIEKGIIEGRKVGIIEGRKEGRKEGREEEKLAIANNLLSILDDEAISINTGLDLEKVKKLRLEKNNKK